MHVRLEKIRPMIVKNPVALLRIEFILNSEALNLRISLASGHADVQLPEDRERDDADDNCQREFGVETG